MKKLPLIVFFFFLFGCGNDQKDVILKNVKNNGKFVTNIHKALEVATRFTITAMFIL